MKDNICVVGAGLSAVAYIRGISAASAIMLFCSSDGHSDTSVFSDDFSFNHPGWSNVEGTEEVACLLQKSFAAIVNSIFFDPNNGALSTLDSMMLFSGTDPYYNDAHDRFLISMKPRKEFDNKQLFKEEQRSFREFEFGKKKKRFGR